MVAAGTIVVLAIIVVIGVITAGDEEDAEPKRRAAPSNEGLTLENARIGARMRKPPGWSVRRASRSLTLRNRERSVVVAVSLPPGSRSSSSVIQTALAAIRSGYLRVRVLGKPTGRRVASLPTRSIVTRAVNRNGAKLRILTASPQGRRRAWLVQVFAREGVSNAELAPAQRALDTLQLSG